MRFIAKIGLLIGMFAVVVSLVLGASTCVGAALHWLMPSVDFGLAIIIGLISLFASFGMVVLAVQVSLSTSSMKHQVDDESDEEDDDDEDDQEVREELIARHVAKELFSRIDAPSSMVRRR